ncbi:MAG: DUF1028 domain-containing protein [Candidatus Zixiibacteriota bacterium]
MTRTIVMLLSTTIALSTASAGEMSDAIPMRPSHTYSIVCYDSATGQFGAAVQSHWFKVANVIWAEPGVGAIATQSFSDYRYGLLGLEMMRAGKSAQEALAGLLASDPNEAVRQVGMIDIHGGVVAHTGSKCIADAGHRVGVNYSVQANLMLKNTVWDAMAEAFENAKGDLADRMMAALEAAQAEGGDIRGKQSAAMIVVAAKPTGLPWQDRLVDIRVDDSAEPLRELKRLLEVTRAYQKMDEGDNLVTLGKFDDAGTAYAEAARLNPDNVEILFWHAVTLAYNGQVERSLPIFKEVFAKAPIWRELVPRLVKPELLPDDPKLIERIVSQ